MARNGCREVGVARWPLTGSRAGPTFEDEASPATRFRGSCVGELRRDGWEVGGSDKVGIIEEKRGWRVVCEDDGKGRDVGQ